MRVTYSLTAIGDELGPAIHELQGWAKQLESDRLTPVARRISASSVACVQSTRRSLRP